MPELRRTTPRLREKRGYYNAEFYDRTTRRRKWHSLGTQSKKIAERRLRAITRAWEDGTFDPFRDRYEFEAMTIEKAAQRYLKSQAERLKPSSLKAMTSVLRLLVDACPPKLSLAYVEPRHVKSVVQRPPSPHSRRSYHRSLRVFFRWCVSEGFIPRDVTDDVARPRAPKKNPLFLSRSDFARLAAHIDRTDAAMMGALVRFGVSTGGRLGELLQLTFADVDAESGLVHFRASGTVSGRARTNKSLKDRAVPLVPMARSAYESRLHLWPTSRVPLDAPLFWSQAGEAYGGHGSYVSHAFKRYVREVAAVEDGFSDEYTFHSLRHTFASWLRLAGVPLDRIQYWMGHRSVTTTEIYAHIVPRDIQKESAHVFPVE